MRVLLIKTSSMGDIIHTLPALTDAQKAIPHLSIDWVIEEAFAEIPTWHASVSKVFPISLRRWRKNLLAPETRAAWRMLRQQLKSQQYDYILDAQGLVKSAILTRYAKGIRVGLDWSSAREPLASLFYQEKYTVNFYQHAIVRMRQLFRQALHFTSSSHIIDYGVKPLAFNQKPISNRYIVFLHGTTWDTKLWPEVYWIELANIVNDKNIQVVISGGNDVEVARAERIARACKNVLVQPRLTINQMANVLAHAKAVVAVDTGFGHLAAALQVPTVSIYGATDPNYTGALGPSSLHMTSQLACSPCLNRQCKYQGTSQVKPACYQENTPERVWDKLASFL